ncbi:tail fiber domain-containing protein [Pinibacter soli]|uniref:Tail fiber domain-containing protein n=1 Tax=Pinibacter soli TaxID=3044211 RepID=A0ABT6RGE1_9BACT|nr:tail fiber domain-containing protein [Pinibacter soli]MDI3321641.1 tail fiber domain-containing protein [Pinibacter soli]
MRKSFYYACVLASALSVGKAHAQTGIAINDNNATADASAMLDVSVNATAKKGFLLPRMTSTQRDAIASPAKGLLIYVTTVDSLEMNVGTSASPRWVAFGNGSGWLLKGNSGTNINTDFVGTTDNLDLAFRTNNFERLRISNTGNVGIGTIAPGYKLTVVGGAANPLALYGVQAGTTTTNDSVLTISNGIVKKVGMSSFATTTTPTGWSLTGNAGTSSSTNFLGTTDDNSLVFKVNNTQSGFIGNSANGYAVSLGSGASVATWSGTYATAIGAGSRVANSQGTAIGGNALAVLSSTAVGYNALTEQEGVALGVNTYAAMDGSAVGLSAIAGYQSIAIGYRAVSPSQQGTTVGAAASASQYQTTAIGANSTATVQSGSAFGANSQATAYQATALGFGASAAGSGSIAAGINASAGGNNAIAIGNGASVNGSASNSTVIGYGTSVSNNVSTATLIGYGASASNNATNVTVLGNGAAASNNVTNVTVVGNGATTSNNVTNGMALGNGAIVGSDNTVVIGNGTNAVLLNNGAYSNSRALVVGNGNTNGNGAYLTTGGVWTNASDRNLKESFSKVNGAEVLAKIMALDVTKWKYKGTNEYHIGPMAQDFFAAFSLGTDDKHISSLDPAGVALVAIKELKKENEALTKKVDDQQKMLEQLLKEVNELKAKVK